MQGKLANLGTLQFLTDVKVANQPPHLSSVYQRVAPYREFFRIYREFNIGLARIFGDFLDLPLARTFDLYEIWCFFRLLRVCAKKFGVSASEIDKAFTPNSSQFLISVKTGSVQIDLQNGYKFGFKRKFREYWLERDGTGSFSRTMEPDIYMSISGQGCKSSQLIVLDAKYRINHNLNEAIASIHMYRDSIVAENPAGVEQQVVGAYLLSPHSPSYDLDWKQSETPGRFFHPKYRSFFRFGALSLTPGLSLSEIDQALDKIIDDSKTA